MSYVCRVYASVVSVQEGGILLCLVNAERISPYVNRRHCDSEASPASPLEAVRHDPPKTNSPSLEQAYHPVMTARTFLRSPARLLRDVDVLTNFPRSEERWTK